jgi:hypothetical protein
MTHLKKINLVPFHPPSTYPKKKKPWPLSLATQKRKKSFMKKTNPLPLLLAHVKQSRKKNINLHPLLLNSKRNQNK